MKRFNEWLSLREEVTFNVKSDNLEDIISGIYRLPDTIKYISVTDRLCSFSPGAQYFAPRDIKVGYDLIKGDIDWRDRAALVLRKLRDDTNEKHRSNPKVHQSWDDIDSMDLVGHTGGGAFDSFYTRFSCPAYREFGKRLSRGDYGPLD